MKTQLTFLLFLIIPLILPAQTGDKQETDKDNWRFAAGVTLLSNRKYTDYNQIRSPLELNFKYRISGNHFVTASGIMSLKNNVFQYPIESFPNKNMTMEEYLEIVRKNDYNTIITIDNHYDLYGGAVGYEYSYSVWKGLSLFGGAEFGYYRQNWFDKNFKNYYYEDNGQLYLAAVFHVDNVAKYNMFSIKPVAGIQYQLKNFIIEAGAGYPYSFVIRKGIENGYSWNGGEIIGHATNNHKTSLHYRFSEFAYKVALHYLF